jgi:hypothetical protein
MHIAKALSLCGEFIQALLSCRQIPSKRPCVTTVTRGHLEQRTTAKMGMKTTRRAPYLCRKQGPSSPTA